MEIRKSKESSRLKTGIVDQLMPKMLSPAFIGTVTGFVGNMAKS